jgi:hypothetical protein
VEIQPGTRVHVVNQPEDPFAGVLLGFHGADVEAEGGGADLLTLRCIVKRDFDGQEVTVPAPAVKAAPG